jgi:hypothetical protein
MKLKRHCLLAAVCSAGFVSGGNASIINSPVPGDAFITFGGLQWAWASPLPGADLSYQGGLGWRLPTPLELAAAPDAVNFMFAGANVPVGGTDPVSKASFQATNANLTGAAACATPYFSNTYLYCDWVDGKGQPNSKGWAGTPGADSSADQLVVRQTPEPASTALLALGLAGLAFRRRRKA